MNMLVVDRPGVRLEIDGQALVVRETDARPRSVPLRHLERVVLVGAIDVDTRVFTRLAAIGCGVACLPSRGARQGAMLVAAGHGDARRRLGQYELLRSDDERHELARRFAFMRVSGGWRLIRQALRGRPDLRRSLLPAADTLARARDRLRISEPVDVLRGIEGAAAAAFFRGYVTLFPASAGFRRRNRRPPRDPVNAALSLGYTLLHQDAVRALGEAGLDPMLGFLHEPCWHRESLACDLVEIGRCRVERMVWRAFAEQRLTASDFTMDGDACRLRKTARQGYYRAYADHADVHRRWFRRMSMALARRCIAASPEPETRD